VAANGDASIEPYCSEPDTGEPDRSVGRPVALLIDRDSDVIDKAEFVDPVALWAATRALKLPGKPLMLAP